MKYLWVRKLDGTRGAVFKELDEDKSLTIHNFGWSDTATEEGVPFSVIIENWGRKDGYTKKFDVKIYDTFEELAIKHFVDLL